MTAPAHSQAALATRAWRAYGDNEPEDQFIARHLPLVRRAVDRLAIHLPPHVEQEDLHSAGMTGLVAAARRYDPALGVPFAAFALRHVRGAVLDELRRMDWMSRGCRRKARQLKEKIAALEQRHGRTVTEEEVCAELNLSAAEYAALLDEVRPITFVPLDTEIDENNSDDLRLHELIPDENHTPARESLERTELHSLLANRIQALPEQPRKVLAMYYFEEMRLAEIAAAFGVTEGRVSQIHTQAILSLRSFVHQVLHHDLRPSCS